MRRRGDACRCPALVDTVFGLLAGLSATLITNLAQRPLRWATPGRVRRREQQIRPDASSSLVAARKVTSKLPARCGGREPDALGAAIHFGIGMAWGPVYGLLRRRGGLGPAGAALWSGLAMSLILDECLVPALGLSAPNRDYPAVTHARGLVVHLIYGAAVAITVEGLGRLAGRPPGRERARPIPVRSGFDRRRNARS